MYIDSYLANQAEQYIQKGKKKRSPLTQTLPTLPKFTEVAFLSFRICTGIHAAQTAFNLAKSFFEKKQGIINKAVEEKTEEGTADKE